MSNKDERLVNIGKQIKQLRKKKNFSQLKLAVLLGISREHLSKVERGATPPSLNLLFDIIELTEGQIVLGKTLQTKNAQSSLEFNT